MPSFLKYAVGSRGILTLNGSTYIEEGNIYANQQLIISDEAHFIFNGKKLVERTTFPSVAQSGESLLFLENPDSNVSKSLNIFDPYAPIYSKANSEFIEVDIEKTFIEKLQVAGISSLGENDPKEILRKWKGSPTTTEFCQLLSC